MHLVMILDFLFGFWGGGGGSWAMLAPSLRGLLHMRSFFSTGCCFFVFSLYYFSSSEVCLHFFVVNWCEEGLLRENWWKRRGEGQGEARIPCPDSWGVGLGTIEILSPLDRHSRRAVKNLFR